MNSVLVTLPFSCSLWLTQLKRPCAASISCSIFKAEDNSEARLLVRLIVCLFNVQFKFSFTHKNDEINFQVALIEQLLAHQIYFYYFQRLLLFSGIVHNENPAFPLQKAFRFRDRLQQISSSNQMELFLYQPTIHSYKANKT